jgi:hypothetical protein
MTEQKSSKGEDGRGIPAGGEQKTVEPPPRDARLIPGGSFKAARLHIGVNAMDKAALPGFVAIEEGVVKPPHVA